MFCSKSHFFKIIPSIFSFQNSNSIKSFILLELLLVAVILGVIFGVSTPLFKRTFSNLSLNNEASKLAKLIKYAQVKAISEQKSIKMVVDVENGCYRLFEKSMGEDEFKEIVGRWGKNFCIASNMKLAIDNNELIFLPNGSITKSRITISNNQEQSLQIEILGGIGRVKIL